MRIGRCEWCDIEYLQIHKTQRFCCRSHSKMGRSGEANNSWKGGRRIHKQSGRITVLVDGRHELEHRVITGVSSGLIVHHKDENPTNNDPSNLAVMTRSEHTRLHNLTNPRRNHNRNERGQFVCVSA
jgi:hypothetical protein